MPSRIAVASDRRESPANATTPSERLFDDRVILFWFVDQLHRHKTYIEDTRATFDIGDQMEIESESKRQLSI